MPDHDQNRSPEQKKDRMADFKAAALICAIGFMVLLGVNDQDYAKRGPVIDLDSMDKAERDRDSLERAKQRDSTQNRTRSALAVAQLTRDELLRITHVKTTSAPAWDLN